MKSFRRIFFALLLTSTLSSFGQPGSPDGLTYKTSLNTIMRLGLDLQKALKPQYRVKVHSQPISIETDMMPFVKMEEFPNEPAPLPMIFISAGFIDLVNLVAHAKAINDKIEKGYFAKYIISLAQESGKMELKPLPNDTDKRFWTEELLNEQYSNFNSIVGVMVGIKLAHHYLGHFQKYRDRLDDAAGGRIPITSLLTPKEWEEALRLGVRNALDAGCAIEGVLPFFECFDKMPKRPEWTSFFVPATAKYKDMRRMLEKIQRDFFSGKDS